MQMNQRDCKPQERLSATAVVVAMALTLLSGCGHKDESGAEPATSSSVSDDSDAGDNGGDPCSLLEVAEVEKAVGPLAGSPYREGMNGPEVGGGKCVYETRDLHVLMLDVTWSDGESIMKLLGMPAAMADQHGMKGQLPLPDGVTITGEWDEAKALSCCEITALRGDQVIAIDFMGTDLSVTQGTELLNAALGRLDKPLTTIHGDTGVPAAEKREAANPARPAPVAACELVTAADAAALLGPVDTLPEDRTNQCQYRATAKKLGLVDFKVDWRGGYRDWRSDREMASSVIQGLLGGNANAPDDAAPTVDAVTYPGPWEKADLIAMSFVAVRQDVIMRIDIRGISVADAKTLMAQAMERVKWPAAGK